MCYLLGHLLQLRNQFLDSKFINKILLGDHLTDWDLHIVWVSKSIVLMNFIKNKLILLLLQILINLIKYITHKIINCNNLDLLRI